MSPKSVVLSFRAVKCRRESVIYDIEPILNATALIRRILMKGHVMPIVYRLCLFYGLLFLVFKIVLVYL